jgi:hypothetical protein
MVDENRDSNLKNSNRKPKRYLVVVAKILLVREKQARQGA